MILIAILLALAGWALPAEANDIVEISKQNLKCLENGITGTPRFPFNAALISGYRYGRPGEFFVSGPKTFELQKSDRCHEWPCPTRYEGRSIDGTTIKFTVWGPGRSGSSGKRVEGAFGYRGFVCDIN